MNLKEIEELEALLPSNAELRKETGHAKAGLKTSEHNKKTWANPATRKARIKGIRKTKADAGAMTKALIKEVYDNSWGPDRRDGYVEKALKTVRKTHPTISIHSVYHMIVNDYVKVVSDAQHKKNMLKWEQQHGFGIYELTPPSVTLLDEYDKAHEEHNGLNYPPSVVWHVRFKMANATPKEVRDYLLPWTGGKYLTSPGSGKIENGRYIVIRKLLYSFLTDKKSKSFLIKNRDELNEFLNEKLGRKINNQYMHQVLATEIRKLGPLAGWKIAKVK